MVNSSKFDFNEATWIAGALFAGSVIALVGLTAIKGPPILSGPAVVTESADSAAYSLCNAINKVPGVEKCHVRIDLDRIEATIATENAEGLCLRFAERAGSSPAKGWVLFIREPITNETVAACGVK